MSMFMLKMAFLSLLIGCCVSGHAAELLNDVSYQSVLALPYTEPDQTLFYGPAEQQYVQLRKANSASKQSTATVVFIHGGCWLNRFTVEHSRALTTALAKQGMDVWSVEYRRTGDEGGGWPGSLEDVKLAINKIANQYETTINNGLYVLGHSAGGHLALLAAYHDPRIKRVIGLAAITNIIEYGRGSNSCQKATSSFMNGLPQELPTEYSQAMVDFNQLKNPVLLLHGRADKIVPTSHSIEQQASYIVVNKAGHFDWIHTQTLAYKVLLNSLKQSFKNNQKYKHDQIN